MGRIKNGGGAFALERTEPSLRKGKVDRGGKKLRVEKREDARLGTLERVLGKH